MIHEFGNWKGRIAERLWDAVIVLDNTRHIAFANAAAAQMFGVENPKELIGTAYPEVLKGHRILEENGSPADPTQFASEIAFRERKETHRRVYTHYNPKGIHHWLSVSSFIIPDEADEIKFVGLIFENISRRKKREDQLRFLIESSKVLSITTDLPTRLAQKARLLVPSLADWVTINLVGEDGSLTRMATEHRIPGKVPLVERFATIAAEDPNAVIYRVVKSGKPELFESLSTTNMQVPIDDDERKTLLNALRPCSAMVVPIQSTSRVVGVLSLAYTAESDRHYTQEDIDFMREYGNHLSITIDNARLYDEIARRDASKDAFLATLSHELRNPLAPIKSSLELIQLKNLDEGLADDLKLVEHQFDHMEKLLRDLLDVTRFTLGKVQLTRKPVDLTQLARLVAATHRPAIIQKDIVFALAIPDDPVMISGDSVRIEQILTNLLNNAEKFTLPGGAITLTVKQVGNSAVMSVADTGVGIRADEIDKVFDRYFQGGGRGSHHGSGLGMGLVLVREIVRLHSGSVFAESQGEGKGSTFTITLPVLHVFENQNAGGTEKKSESLQHDTVLVIDDNKDAADSLVKLLAAVGFDASAAYSGTEGIGAFEGTSPRHVIIDIGMPDINGYDVAKELRSRHGRNAHLIALSGYGMDEDKRRAYEAGFNQHLTKPVGLSDLRTVLGDSTVKL
jgi:PAS domain S-box-containing protein